MSNDSATVGLAALSICESLLLSMGDRGLLDELENRNLLEDVIAVHRNAAEAGDNPVLHTAVAQLVNRILKGENAGRAMLKLRSARKV
jgi:hypothetical protein